MKKYEVTLVIESEYDPGEWDWGALLDLSIEENIESIYVEEV